MARRGPPVFLARAAYRRRRLSDAARVLPALGLGVVLLPSLWSVAPDSGGLAARTGLLFALWIGLVAAAAALSRRLRPRDFGPPGPRG